MDGVTATGAQTVDPGRTDPPVAVLLGEEVTAAAVATVKLQSLLRGNETTESGHCATHISDHCYHLGSETKAQRKIIFSMSLLHKLA